MVTNFEEITSELNKRELEIVPVLVEGFKRYTKTNPILSPDVVRRYNSKTKGIKLTPARLRKIINHIRTQGLLPLIGTSKGYYVAYEQHEIAKQIKSLNERANSIRNSAVGLKKFMQ